MSRVIVRANPDLNILFLTLSGIPNEENILNLTLVIQSELSRLKPGFKLLNDARQMEPADLNNYQMLIEAAKEIIKLKPSKIARLCNPFSRMVFNRISAQLGYSGKEFFKMEDALEYLGAGHLLRPVVDRRKENLLYSQAV